MYNTFVSGGTTFFTPGAKNGQIFIAPNLGPVLISQGGILLPAGFLVYLGVVDGTGNQTMPVMQPLGAFPTFSLSGLPAPAGNLNPVSTVAVAWAIQLLTPMALPVQGGTLIQIGGLAAFAWTGAAIPTPGNFSALQIVSAAAAGLI